MAVDTGYKNANGASFDGERDISGLPGAIKFKSTSEDGVYTPIHANNNVISTLNSRAAATLAGDAVFQGVGEDVSKYGRVGVSINSNNATNGILTMEVSHDNVTWGGPIRTWSDTRFAQPHMWAIVEKYFRIKYTNGLREATNLSIQTQYSSNSDINLGHQLNEPLSDELEANLVRAVLVGQSQNGHYHNVSVTESNKLRVEADSFTYLLAELLEAQKKTNQYLQYMTNYPLLDKLGDI